MKLKDGYFILYNGVKVPFIGFGTWQIKDGEEAYNSTLFALKNNYKHIDTAYAYKNEKSIGKAIKDSSLKREEIFVTSKVPAEIKTYAETINHFNKSLLDLGLDYLDLYLIHAPWPWNEVGKNCDKENIEVWKALIDLYKQKKVRAIGVSNFSKHDIENIINATGFKPMVNQIRFFVGNRQDEIYNYCQDNDILVEAYSPLGTGELIDNPEMIKMAKKYNVSVAQIAIKYCLYKNTLPLPKSVHEDRIKLNNDIFFEIDDEDYKYLDSLNYIASTRKLRS